MDQKIVKPKYFFKYVPIEGAKDILFGKRLKWTCPLDFNDPFDIREDFGFEFSNDDYFEQYKKRAFQLLHNDEPVRKNQINWAQMRTDKDARTKVECDEFWDSQKDIITQEHQVLIDQFKNSWRPQIQHYRVISLSENENSLLMWAHYAQKHQGALIRFKVLEDERTHFKEAQPVIYSSNLPFIASLEEWVNQCMGVDVPLDDKKIFQRVVYTKSDEWVYEKEWRCIGEEYGAIERYNLFPEEIDGVIFGCKAKESDVQEIKKYAQAELSHVEISRAVPHPTKFSLLYQKMV